MTHLYAILGVTAGLLVLSILASKVAVRLGVPTLLFFVALGMVAGSEGFGGLWFDYPRVAQAVGVVSLAYILYAAGLETNVRDFRQQMWPALNLATVGVLVSGVLIAAFARLVFHLSWAEGALLGAVVSSTDAAAVFSVLRAKDTNLHSDVRNLIEAESGSNDPMAVFLTFAAITAISHPETKLLTHLFHFVLEMGLGAAIGYFGGKLIIAILNHIRLQFEGLYPVLSIALVCLLFTCCSAVKGNGFLAVYVAGLVVGDATLIHRRSLLMFHDGIAWLLQISMFVILGLQVFPSELGQVWKAGLFISLFLVFVARPISVVISLTPFGFRFREQVFVAWAGLRGAAPIILAIFAVTSAVPHSRVLFNTVFFVAVLSVAVQGTTIAAAAKWLGVLDPSPARRSFPLRYDPTSLPDKQFLEFEVTSRSPADGARIVELRLPHGTLVLLVARGTEKIIPDGSTILRAGDVVQVLADELAVADAEQLFRKERKQIAKS